MSANALAIGLRLIVSMGCFGAVRLLFDILSGVSVIILRFFDPRIVSDDPSGSIRSLFVGFDGEEMSSAMTIKLAMFS